MQEPIKDELVNEIPMDVLPVTDASPAMVSQETPLPMKRVGVGFILSLSSTL